MTPPRCNNPICRSSKAGLFIGIYPHHSGCYGVERWEKYEVLWNLRMVMFHFRAHRCTTRGIGKLMHDMVGKQWKQSG